MKCSECLTDLTEDKDIEFHDVQSVYTLIELVDRGSLKWPPQPVLNAVIKIWMVYTSIESDSTLYERLLTEQSRSILVKLCIIHFESEHEEIWRTKCPSCSTFRWDILKKIIFTICNCILSNTTKNLNSLERS